MQGRTSPSRWPRCQIWRSRSPLARLRLWQQRAERADAAAARIAGSGVFLSWKEHGIAFAGGSSRFHVPFLWHEIQERERCSWPGRTWGVWWQMMGGE